MDNEISIGYDKHQQKHVNEGSHKEPEGEEADIKLNRNNNSYKTEANNFFIS